MPGITCVVCLTNDSVVAPVVAETRTVRPVLRRAELAPPSKSNVQQFIGSQCTVLEIRNTNAAGPEL